MNRAYSSIVALCVGAMALSTVAVGCANSETATLELPLYTEADYFTLDIYGPDGVNLYATGCLLRQARTFRVSNLERVENASILFHYYSDVSCDDAAHVGVGIRGEVTVAKGEERYYHIPVLADGDVTALPIDQNVSAGFATEVTYCEPDMACTEPGAEGLCKKAFDDGTQKFKYWCVPSCEVDSDCTDLHVAATCDEVTNWCMIASPYPLNMSSPRAFGQSATASNGDVLFFGGFSELTEGALSASADAVERYNVTTGLFEVEAWDGDAAVNVAHSGMVTLSRSGEARSALVGGATGAALGADGPMDFTGASGDIVVLDLDDASLVVHADAIEPVVAPGVVASGAVIVAVGGLRADDSGELVSSTAVSRCDVDGVDYTCTQVASLATARTAPAVSCLDDVCSELLVVGGNLEGPVAEVIDFTGSTTEPELTSMASLGLPGAIHWPVVCADKLVGGADADGQGLLPMTMDVDASGGVLTATELENLDDLETTMQAGVFAASDGDCWIFGGRHGVDGTTSAAVWRVTDSAVVAAGSGIALEGARYGATVAAIGSGELSGSVVIAGGLTLGEGADAGALVHGVEIFRP
ncbi:MAG: hypothetical protein ACPGU1_00610 [Myxococcota bacterium]